MWVGAVEAGRETTQIGKQHPDVLRHTAGWREFHTSPAHGWVLARRPVAERRDDPTTKPGERGPADPATRAARERSEDRRERTTEPLLVKPPGDFPVLRLEWLTSVAARRPSQLPDSHPLPHRRRRPHPLVTRPRHNPTLHPRRRRPALRLDDTEIAVRSHSDNFDPAGRIMVRL